MKSHNFLCPNRPTSLKCQMSEGQGSLEAWAPHASIKCTVPRLGCWCRAAVHAPWRNSGARVHIEVKCEKTRNIYGKWSNQPYKSYFWCHCCNDDRNYQTKWARSRFQSPETNFWNNNLWSVFRFLGCSSSYFIAPLKFQQIVNPNPNP